jgi:uncharacterized protein (DUF2126 family)
LRRGGIISTKIHTTVGGNEFPVDLWDVNAVEPPVTRRCGLVFINVRYWQFDRHPSKGQLET